MTSDPVEILDSEIKKLENGITSKRRAIMKVNDIDEAEAMKILEEINAENIDLTGVGVTNPADPEEKEEIGANDIQTLASEIARQVVLKRS